MLVWLNWLLKLALTSDFFNDLLELQCEALHTHLKFGNFPLITFQLYIR